MTYLLRDTLLILDEEERVIAVFMPPPKDVANRSNKTFWEACDEVTELMDDCQTNRGFTSKDRRGSQLNPISMGSSHGQGRPVCLTTMRSLLY